jgi:hypothetical protein
MQFKTFKNFELFLTAYLSVFAMYGFYRSKRRLIKNPEESSLETVMSFVSPINHPKIIYNLFLRMFKEPVTIKDFEEI